jgi:hypothetical protein
MRAVQLDPSRFANDAPEEFVDCAIVERSTVHLPQPGQHILFAVGITKRQLLRFLDCAHFQGETCAHVQEAQQLGVDLVDLIPPVFYVHVTAPGETKNQPRLFRIAAGSFEGVVLAFRFSAHLFRTSPARSPNTRSGK